MSKISRRTLANYGVEQLLAGKSAKEVAKALAAELKDSARTAEVQFLTDDIIWQLEQRQILVIGRVTSAHTLSAKLKNELTSELKKLTDAKSVMLEESIDKSVLGGLRLETSNKVWDKTIAKKLSTLKESA